MPKVEEYLFSILRFTSSVLYNHPNCGSTQHRDGLVQFLCGCIKQTPQYQIPPALRLNAAGFFEMITAHRTHEQPIDVPAAGQPQRHHAAEEAVVPFEAVGVKSEDKAGKEPQESDPEGPGDKAAPGFIKVELLMQHGEANRKKRIKPPKTIAEMQRSIQTVFALPPSTSLKVSAVNKQDLLTIILCDIRSDLSFDFHTDSF